MITKLILDAIGQMSDGTQTELLRAGLPVAFHAFAPGDHVEIELPGGRVVEVEAGRVDADHEPEETLSALSEALSIPYDTLARYAREGRFLARRSGNIYLSTRTAVEYAGIRPRKNSQAK